MCKLRFEESADEIGYSGRTRISLYGKYSLQDKASVSLDYNSSSCTSEPPTVNLAWVCV